jgi:tRNA-2-methylthio-N6-dimethylallyladenosine synthase
MQIAVGGCLAQKDRAEIVRRAPWVDVVFGTHNVHALPVLLERRRHNETAQVEIAEALEVFPSTLPARRESPTPAGCRSRSAATTPARSASSPSLRGTERDRRPGDVWPRCGRWPPTACSR